MKLWIIAAAAAHLAAATAASAHASFAETEARQGVASRFTLQVPHGCGTEATLKLRIRIPQGLVAVKPMPKPGWNLEIVEGAYDAPQTVGGSTVTEGVREVIWTGELPDAHYDEFVFRATVTRAVPHDTMLYIPAVQDCANGSERWIEIPATGQDSHSLKRPAPAVKVVPAGMHSH